MKLRGRFSIVALIDSLSIEVPSFILSISERMNLLSLLALYNSELRGSVVIQDKENSASAGTTDTIRAIPKRITNAFAGPHFFIAANPPTRLYVY
jgi:hypothetical protein